MHKSMKYLRRAEALLKSIRPEDVQSPHAPALAKVNILLALAQPRDYFAKYSPDQPRDWHGRWTTGGDSGAQQEKEKGTETFAGDLTPMAQHTMTREDYIKRKQDFVDAHLAETEQAAKALNVPVENILGLAGLESEWGDSIFAIHGNNFFGLYYPAPYGIPNAFIPAADNPDAKMAKFNSYEDSLNSFIDSNGDIIQGKSDPTAFMSALQDSGKFGINTDDGSKMPTYVQDGSATIRGLRSVIVNTQAKPKKMKSHLALLILTGLMLISPCYATEVPKKVDGETGKKLVESLFTHLPPWIDELDNLQDFIVYDIHGERQGMHDTYAVNPWTGDVWNLWSCKRESNAAIRKALAEIKKRFSNNEIAHYKRLHKLRPYSVGLDPC